MELVDTVGPRSWSAWREQYFKLNKPFESEAMKIELKINVLGCTVSLASIGLIFVNLSNAPSSIGTQTAELEFHRIEISADQIILYISISQLYFSQRPSCQAAPQTCRVRVQVFLSEYILCIVGYDHHRAVLRRTCCL
jgi:hypothetical protein